MVIIFLWLTNCKRFSASVRALLREPTSSKRVFHCEHFWASLVFDLIHHPKGTFSMLSQSHQTPFPNLKLPHSCSRSKLNFLKFLIASYRCYVTAGSKRKKHSQKAGQAMNILSFLLPSFSPDRRIRGKWELGTSALTRRRAGEDRARGIMSAPSRFQNASAQ